MLHRLDIKHAFQFGDVIEKVYIEPPPRFIAQGDLCDFVCRLYKASYNLKQSLRAWSDKVSAVLQKFCITQSKAGHSTFYKHSFTNQFIYFVYVDDIVIPRDDHDGTQHLQQHLFQHFQTICRPVDLSIQMIN